MKEKEPEVTVAWTKAGLVRFQRKISGLASAFDAPPTLAMLRVETKATTEPSSSRGGAVVVGDEGGGGGRPRRGHAGGGRERHARHGSGDEVGLRHLGAGGEGGRADGRNLVEENLHVAVGLEGGGVGGAVEVLRRERRVGVAVGVRGEDDVAPSWLMQGRRLRTATSMLPSIGERPRP